MDGSESARNWSSKHRHRAALMAEVHSITTHARTAHTLTHISVRLITWYNRILSRPTCLHPFLLSSGSISPEKTLGNLNDRHYKCVTNLWSCLANLFTVHITGPVCYHAYRSITHRTFSSV